MLTRRRLLHAGSSIGIVTGALGAFSEVHGQNAQYVYDPLGRLLHVDYGNGHWVSYVYDAAGNRSEIFHGSGAYTATIQVSGAGPVNLHNLALLNSYVDTTDATITFAVSSGVSITGAPGTQGAAGLPAIDTGTWPTGSHTISITLLVMSGGKVYGGGGAGGAGAGLVTATTGGVGGDAVYCQLPMAVTVQSGGEIKSGGGGGGGGGGWKNTSSLMVWGGGGGGGGFANGTPGPGGGTGDPDGEPGSYGTTSGGGAGGAGVSAGLGRASGAGGAGGGAAVVGSNGVVASGTATGTMVKVGAWSGGAAGYAIRKNGNTVTVTNSGTITGTQA